MKHLSAALSLLVHYIKNVLKGSRVELGLAEWFYLAYLAKVAADLSLSRARSGGETDLRLRKPHLHHNLGTISISPPCCRGGLPPWWLCSRFPLCCLGRELTSLSYGDGDINYFNFCVNLISQKLFAPGSLALFRSCEMRYPSGDWQFSAAANGNVDKRDELMH